MIDSQYFLEGGVGKLLFPIVNISIFFENSLAFVTKEIIIFFKMNEWCSPLTPWLWNTSMIGECWCALYLGNDCASILAQGCAPSPLPTMPTARTASLLFHDCLHFFLTQFQESEPGRLASMSQHVLQLFTCMHSLNICVSEIASMYYFKWEKLDTVIYIYIYIYIYIVCYHLCNLSQPKFLHVSKCLCVIVKHNEYII